MCFSQDEKFAALGTTNGSVRIFNPRGGSEFRTLKIREGPISALAFSPDNRLLLTTKGRDQTSHVLFSLRNTETEAEEALFQGPRILALASVCAFSPDGACLVYPGPDWALNRWDVSNKKQLPPFKGLTWTTYSARFSPDGKLLAGSSWDGDARIWDVATARQMGPPLRGHFVGVNRVQFTPDNRTLLTSGDDISARLWSVANGQELVTIKHAQTAMLAEDGHSLVLLDTKGLIQVESIPTLAEIDAIQAKPSSGKK
jgi:WD40 repeat protein